MGSRPTKRLDADPSPVADYDSTTSVRIQMLKNNIKEEEMENYLLKMYIVPDAGYIKDNGTFRVQVSGKQLGCEVGDKMGLLTKVSATSGCYEAGKYKSCIVRDKATNGGVTNCVFSCTHPNLENSHDFSVVYLRLAYFSKNILAEISDVRMLY